MIDCTDLDLNWQYILLVLDLIIHYNNSIAELFSFAEAYPLSISQNKIFPLLSLLDDEYSLIALLADFVEQYLETYEEIWLPQESQEFPEYEYYCN